MCLPIEMNMFTCICGYMYLLEQMDCHWMVGRLRLFVLFVCYIHHSLFGCVWIQCCGGNARYFTCIDFCVVLDHYGMFVIRSQ